MKRKVSKRTKQKYIFVYSMMAFALIHFAVFWVYVNLDSFALAFIDKNTGMWNNFSYFKLFLNDLASGAQSELLGNLKNTLTLKRKKVKKSLHYGKPKGKNHN